MKLTATRLAAVFPRLIDYLAVAAAGILLVRLYAIYACIGLRLNHDEAEHLHVAFALERGERPYLDFIENHPMLFNLGILTLKRMFPQDTVLGLYMLVRLSAFLAFAGCIYYLYRLCADYCRHVAGQFRAVSVLMLVFVFIDIVPEANSYLWDVRPDWFCYLLSVACIHAHYSVHSRSRADWRAGDLFLLALGGLAGGLATAVLPKSLYIFVPYALVVSLAFVRRIHVYRMDLGRLFAANMLFVGVGMLGFCAAVAGDIYTTGTTLDAYYKANFVINRTAHPVASLEETPFSQLVTMVGGEYRTLLVALSASVMLLVVSFRSGRHFEFYILVFALSLVGFNGMLLASTNGAYWMHNFAPSMLGILCMGFVLLLRVLMWLAHALKGLAMPTLSGQPSAVLSSLAGYGAASFFALSIGFSLVIRAGDAAASFENLELSRTIRKPTVGGQPMELVADRLLPSDLVYLVFDPRSMPLRARHWGYYFMLSPDRDFWQDNHVLGLGPDAGTYWKSLYAISPPDAILLPDVSGGYWRVRERLLLNQAVDISWLKEALNRDYVCLYQSVVTVHVRTDRMAAFGSPEWKRCRA